MQDKESAEVQHRELEASRKRACATRLYLSLAWSVFAAHLIFRQLGHVVGRQRRGAQRIQYEGRCRRRAHWLLALGHGGSA